MTWSQVDRDTLLITSGRDPFVRFATSTELVAVAAEDGAGWACVSPWRQGAAHWGGAAVVAPDAPPDAESQALRAIVDAAHDEVRLEWFSTRDRRDLELPEHYVATGSGRWAFMWTERTAGVPLPQGLADQDLELVELEDRADAEHLEAFGREHSDGPYQGFPGRGFATLWLAVRDREGSTVAVGALHELASGMPHLAGVVVRPAARGRGIGMLLTEALTARAVEEAGVATLGVDTDNQGALRLYERLGYATAHRFHTRDLGLVDQHP